MACLFSNPSPSAILLSSIGLFLAGALGAGFSRSSHRRSLRFGLAGAVGGGLAGLWGAVAALHHGAPDIRLPWHVPGGIFHVGSDPLSALFLVPVFIVTTICAVYAAGYWKREPARQAAEGWCFYNLLTAAMAMVLIARHALLFVAAWEAMTLTSFRLISFSSNKTETHRAAWIYLVASQAGAACLLAMFMLLGEGRAGMSFDELSGFAGRMPATVPLVLSLGAIGFGVKAGLLPLHGWLPLAHPAAPSPVSAVMSGVMIKTGIYGLLRLAVLSGGVPAWFGGLLLASGLVSAAWGVARTLGRDDLKEVLAFSSVENIGLIAAGLGLGFLGVAWERPHLAALGLTAGLLHTFNHGLMKSLMFLGAGSAVSAAGTRSMNRLGGLWKRMPVTAPAVLIGCAAIAGLPPLNGFAGEFLLFMSGFSGVRAGGAAAVAGLVTIATVSLVGGLAVASFVRVFGVVFLGEPRTTQAADSREAGAAMRGAVAVLALLCVCAGLAAAPLARAVAPAIAILAPGAGDADVIGLGRAVLAGAGAMAVAGMLAWAGRFPRTRRAGAVVGTWDCGYIRPTARMQYTATSFSRPLRKALHPANLPDTVPAVPRELFAEPVTFEAPALSAWQHKINAGLQTLMLRLSVGRLLQHGNIHLYILYIAGALILLLLIGLRS